MGTTIKWSTHKLKRAETSDCVQLVFSGSWSVLSLLTITISTNRHNLLSMIEKLKLTEYPAGNSQVLHFPTFQIFCKNFNLKKKLSSALHRTHPRILDFTICDLSLSQSPKSQPQRVSWMCASPQDALTWWRYNVMPLSRNLTWLGEIQCRSEMSTLLWHVDVVDAGGGRDHAEIVLQDWLGLEVGEVLRQQVVLTAHVLRAVHVRFASEAVASRWRKRFARR